jgi:hypothetical protein
MRMLLCLSLIALISAVTAPASAALPPLSLEELREQSDVIVTGTVVSVESGVRARDENGEFADDVFFIKLKVASVQKGDGVAAGEAISAETWKPKVRPDGFAGPQGQNFIPKKGDNVRMFCRVEDGKLMVLEPNGIAKLGAGNKGKGKEKPQQSP